MDYEETNSSKTLKWASLLLSEFASHGLRAFPRDSSVVFFRRDHAEEVAILTNKGELHLLTPFGSAENATTEQLEGFCDRELRTKDVLLWLRQRVQRVFAGQASQPSQSVDRDERYLLTWKILGLVGKRLSAFPVRFGHSPLVTTPHPWVDRLAAADRERGIFSLGDLVFTDLGFVYNRGRMTVDLRLLEAGRGSGELVDLVLRHRVAGLSADMPGICGHGGDQPLGRFLWFSKSEAVAVWKCWGPQWHAWHEEEHGAEPPKRRWASWRYETQEPASVGEGLPVEFGELVNTWGFALGPEDRSDDDFKTTSLVTADRRWKLLVTLSPGVGVASSSSDDFQWVEVDGGGHPYTGAVHPTRPWVAVFSDVVSVVDVEKRRQVFSFQGVDDPSWRRTGVFHPAGRFLLAAGAKGILFWDLESHALRLVLANNFALNQSFTGPLHVSPDGRYVLVQSASGPVAFRWEDLEERFGDAPEHF
jgi:hypothetical protein